MNSALPLLGLAALVLLGQKKQAGPKVTIGPARILPSKTRAQPAMLKPIAKGTVPGRAAIPASTPKAGQKPTNEGQAAMLAAQAAAAAQASARPPASLTNLALARSTAKAVAAHIKNAGRGYNVAVLKQFQTRAGLQPDGLYGPLAASALKYFGAAAPPPLFKGSNTPYSPPGG